MSGTNVVAWLPVTVLPVAAFLFIPTTWPRWVFMWLFAVAVFAGCKWLTWWFARTGAPWMRQLGYLLAWPGMDAPTFLLTPSHRRPSWDEWLFALGKLAFGVVLLAIVIPRLSAGQTLLRGWVGMVGIIFVLHFGLFHLLSLGWQASGVSAKPLMNWPIRARSVSEFWGQRWNTAFRDLTHRFLFRPLTARYGAKVALAVGFLLSGLIHDLVISLPAGAGYGGPTIFFLVQAGAIFVERSDAGHGLGLGRGVPGWAFTMLVLVGPIFLLFHPPFVETIVVPFVDDLLNLAGLNHE